MFILLTMMFVSASPKSAAILSEFLCVLDTFSMKDVTSFLELAKQMEDTQ